MPFCKVHFYFLLKPRYIALKREPLNTDPCDYDTPRIMCWIISVYQTRQVKMESFNR